MNREIKSFIFVSISMMFAAFVSFVYAKEKTNVNPEIYYVNNVKEDTVVTDILEEIAVPSISVAESTLVTEHIKSNELRVAWSDKIKLTMEDFYMICNTVQHEVGNCSAQEQVMVALTILNRVNSDSFPDTVYEVLTAPKQYNPKYTDYSDFGWTEMVEQSVTYALESNDYHPDMVYYRANHYFSGSYQKPYMHVGGCWFSLQNK